jgi:general secretion pathway protein A
MLLDHYGLIEQPFGVTLDPRFLHMGPKHREAVASLVYGTESSRGFLALIAQPGMGKTSLLFQFLEYLRNRTRTAYIFHTDCDSRDFLRYLLTDLGVDTNGKDMSAMHGALNQILLEEMRAGRRFILVIDEAQNLRENVLESVRLLSNFETPWMKLMQIVLAGQPQLAERLARPSMAQLRQRISSLIRLDPFTQEETSAYINHRLWVAGHRGPDLFTPGARLSIAQYTGGIPRAINTLCFNAMSIAYAMDAKKIDVKIVQEAASDLEVESLIPREHTSVRVSVRRSAQSHVQSRGYVPFSSTIPAKETGKPWRIAARTVSVAAVLFLAVVSGLSWNSGAGTPPFDLVPTAEAAAFHAKDMLVSGFRGVGGAHVSPTRAAPTQSSVADKQAGSLVATVVVERQDTLRHLSLEYLNRFDDKTIDEIRALNPAITDPDRIETGQRLRLPIHLRRPGLSGTQPAAQVAPTSSREVNR